MGLDKQLTLLSKEGKLVKHDTWTSIDYQFLCSYTMLL